MKHIAAVLLACLAPLPLAAHPHVFVDTGLRAIFDDSGRLTHVDITWRYDEFYSLLITEDMGLDDDYDGQLTEAEITQLTGFDMQWIEGFNGDLAVSQDGRVLPLSGPTDFTATFDEGRITTTHRRAVLAPVDGRAAPIVIKPFDETYYTAYEITSKVEVEGAENCRARVRMPDMTADLSALQAELAELDANMDPQDVGLPNLGEALAAEATVTCAELG
jgi:ABC-type uncharacterized transport system substrate-binding protein